MKPPTRGFLDSLVGNGQPPGSIRLETSVEGARRSRSAGALGSRSGERESWQSACRRCAWQESATENKKPREACTCRGLVRKAQAFRSRRKAWSGGDRRLGHAGRDFHGENCLKTSDCSQPRRVAKLHCAQRTAPASASRRPHADEHLAWTDKAFIRLERGQRRLDVMPDQRMLLLIERGHHLVQRTEGLALEPHTLGRTR